MTFVIFKKPRFWFPLIFLFEGFFFLSSNQCVFSLKQIKKSLILLIFSVVILLERFRHKNELRCTSSLTGWMLSYFIEDFFSVNLSFDGWINDFVTKFEVNLPFIIFRNSFTALSFFKTKKSVSIISNSSEVLGHGVPE